jgi:ferredoxin--NADP+ reductase
VTGRVQRNGSTATGEYVVGWIKRGPTGVIGTNKGDAKETVEQLLAALDALPRARHREPNTIIDTLAQRGVGVVTWAGWEAIDAAEQALGVAAGRTRIKIADRETLLTAAAKALTG